MGSVIVSFLTSDSRRFCFHLEDSFLDDQVEECGLPLGGSLHCEAQLLHGPLQVLLGRQRAPGSAQIHIAAEIQETVSAVYIGSKISQCKQDFAKATDFRDLLMFAKKFEY